MVRRDRRSLTSIDEALPAMQELASRLWSPASRHHPGQLAWSARYALPDELDHGPVALFHDLRGRVVGWAWAEAPDWLELCVEPGRPDGVMVASCLVWLDPATGVALVEPVGCAPDHRGRGLAAAVSLAALHAARRAGATRALVCPRGDDGYPVPQRIYRRMGFEPGARTRTLALAGAPPTGEAS